MELEFLSRKQYEVRKEKQIKNMQRFVDLVYIDDLHVKRAKITDLTKVFEAVGLIQH